MAKEISKSNFSEYVNGQRKALNYIHSDSGTLKDAMLSDLG